MSIKYWSQVGVGFLVFGFTALFSWYEGSALLDNPWEWKYSTPFSEMIHGSVLTREQIVELDFFVYAAKYSPLFPSVMVMSVSYLLVLLGYILLKHRGFPLFLTLFGMVYLLMSALIASSPTTGGNILFWLFILIGIFLIILASLFHFSPSLRMKGQSRQA
ncbi:YjdJ family protein [Rossellomorea sp. NRS-1567]|uniref:YjdJ family protein n=1 Tax=Rossellomorea sp. NRS-1567 TaxID=3233901 RepID=UPI003D2B61A8